MANKALEAFQDSRDIEFWLDGEQKSDFVVTIVSPVEKVKMAVKQGVFMRLVTFYVKCRLRRPLRDNEAEVSTLVYQKLILSFLDLRRQEHTFRLFDKARNIILEATFEEKDAFLSILRILDEYGKAILINQYNLAPQDIQGKVVVDGGSNMGEFAIYCARLGAKKVYAFEPLKTTFEILKKQIALNGLENIIVPVQKALGDKNETVHINFSDAGDSAATICTTTKATLSEEIQAVKLDDFVGSETVGFIKLDVEGYEENVLFGAAGVIKRDKPVLALSAYHKPTDKQRLPEVVLSIRPDYSIELLTKAEQDFYCK